MISTQPPDKQRIRAFFSGENSYMICCAIASLTFILSPQNTISIVSNITQSLIQHFGLAFIISSSVIVIICLFIASSRYGNIRIGGTDARPDFGTLSWLAMLFAAGMGSGLIFWGVAEPIFHYANPPAFAQDAEPLFNTALALTYFHWGIHAWSIYAITGLAMAWFAFNRGRALSISASFTCSKHFAFKSIDLLAVFAIMFGLAGTLANSIALIQTGANQTLSWDLDHYGFRLFILALMTVVFTYSSVLGLKKGIKRLSQFNLVLAGVLFVTVCALVNPLQVLTTIASSTWQYLLELPKLSFSIDEESRNWSEGWSIIYLLWWIAWAPFVAPFVASISRGRTIRQFLSCVILVPTLFSIIWFSLFAGGAFQLPILNDVISATLENYTNGLFTFFSYFTPPWALILSIISIVLLTTFVITSADSAIYVTGSLTGNNSIFSKIIWSLILTAITAALVYINNVDLNKQIAIVGALPFSVILLAQIFLFLKDLIKVNRDKL